MLIALVTLYILISVVFFVALAFAARQPIPAIQPNDLKQEAAFTAPKRPAPEPKYSEELAAKAA